MLSAWIDLEGSDAAFVYDNPFSAARSADGDWEVPAPSGVNVRDLYADGYTMASDEEEATLLKEARMSVKESPVRDK
jgi:hypothetical protein